MPNKYQIKSCCNRCGSFFAKKAMQLQIFCGTFPKNKNCVLTAAVGFYNFCKDNGLCLQANARMQTLQQVEVCL